MEIVDVRYLGSDGQYQTYAPSDTSLINTSFITANYGVPGDYIEYFIKDLNNVILSSNYYTTKYDIGDNIDPVTGTTTQLFLDPEGDARVEGYDRGIVNVKYNFFRTQLRSAPDPSQHFWIKEISTSRTEIKVARQDLSNTELSTAFVNFDAILAADAYYPDFYLNFGADVQLIAINAVYVEEDGNGYVIFKLYEPLPAEYDLKSTFWVVTEVANPAEFSVSIEVTPEIVVDSRQIKGPNFKVGLNDKVSQTTPYYSYNSLFATAVTSSYQQLQSLMQEKGIQINVDYGSFDNFIHFSSATERLYNFVYKVQLIESASAGLTATNTNTAKVLLQSQIDSTITNFDGYEYYLYFTSESTAWPKQSSTQPYDLYSVTSSQVSNWLGSITATPTPTTMSMFYSASRYDDLNKDWLLHTTPSYITEDESNAPYFTFLNMIGQHFDNIWIYLKDVTNHYSAENNPFVGISMDQVADALRSFGIQLYTNTSVSDNVYYSMLGINQTGSNLPVTSSLYSVVEFASSSLLPLSGNQWLSSSLLLPPFGEEKINRYVTTFVTGAANFTSSFETLPSSQITDEVYKRIYHNLAYLLKTRGTERGVKALIATYGVPNDILTVHEYGGYDYLEVPGIQEISNTRIITGSVAQISSSLLSPNVTLQYYNNDLENTSINVEVAFSPADSINASITSSGYVTSSTQPGYFNIMQLIGDPNLQYSSSYTPLVEVSDTYFNAEYTSRYNVWDFIRVIKYYNNSLFKMLRDWVPARTSPSTGIVIKSHMLERNKYPRKEPTWSTSSYDADYLLLTLTGSSGGSVTQSTAFLAGIPIQYNGTASIALTGSFGTVYMSSSNNVQQYNGEFSGSYIQASYNVFPQTYVSNYNYPWTSSVPGNGPLFLTYSLSPIFENVNVPVRSQRFLDLDYNSTQLAPVNYGLVTASISQSNVIGNISQSEQPYSQYAFIQDFNYSSRPYTIPRYSGSYLSGLYYNTHSAGDISYGDDPVINWNTSKLGFFTQIQTSSFLPGKVNATMAYLSDVSGGLYELNQNNKNWVDVQNTFKAGTTLTVKQFDAKKYSNQVSTEGIKTIYNSGYSYTPELYFLSGADNRIYFEYLGTSAASSGFTAVNGGNSGTNYFISGTASPYYPSINGGIYNMFDTVTIGTGYTTGSGTTNPFYTVSAAGQLSFNANFAVNINFQSSAQSASYTFNVFNGPTNVGTQTAAFTSSVVSAAPGTITFGRPVTGETISAIGTLNGSVTPGTYDVYDATFGGGSPLYVTTSIALGTPSPVGLTQRNLLDSFLNPIGVVNAIDIADDPNGTFAGYYWSDGFYIVGGFPTPPTSPVNILSGQVNINLTTVPNTYTNTDVITFQLTQSVSTSNFTASLTQGSLIGTVANVGQGGYPFATASTADWFIDDIFNTTQQSTIVFNNSISNFYQYQQVPAFVSGSSSGTPSAYTSSLYPLYGDINSPFDPVFGDKIVLTDTNGVTQEVDIISASVSGSGELTVSVSPQLLGNWIQNPKLIYRVLMLKRYNNEQNVILTFNKAPGQTSYGFLIPQTISPKVTDNINALQAAVQSQILSNQTTPGIDTINGGTFG